MESDFNKKFNKSVDELADLLAEIFIKQIQRREKKLLNKKSNEEDYNK